MFVFSKTFTTVTIAQIAVSVTPRRKYSTAKIRVLPFWDIEAIEEDDSITHLYTPVLKKILMYLFYSSLVSLHYKPSSGFGGRHFLHLWKNSGGDDQRANHGGALQRSGGTETHALVRVGYVNTATPSNRDDLMYPRSPVSTAPLHPNQTCFPLNKAFKMEEATRRPFLFLFSTLLIGNNQHNMIFNKCNNINIWRRHFCLVGITKQSLNINIDYLVTAHAAP